MRTAYKILAYAVALEVVVQAAAMVWAIAGLGIWVDEGGVFDKALMESEEMPFTEIIGIIVHGINGMLVIPVIALLLLICSFFARVPGGVKWAGLVLLLVVLQITLGLFGHAVAGIGALHGVNALVLFSAAVHTARRASAPAGAHVAPAEAPAEAPVVAAE
jgi:hypothetical protein